MGTARITFLLALGASLWGASASAIEVDAPRPEAEASATVTVTAEALPVEIVQTPNPVVVIDKDVIDRSGAANLTDLLQKQLPGQISTFGEPGMAGSIALGGSRPQDTAVTLDGLRLEDAIGTGGVNTSMIGLAGIDRIEVQQGPCSTRFGSDAMGGAVALYSAGSAPAGFTGEVRAGAGTQGIVRGSLGAAYGWDQGWVRMALSAQKQDQVLDPNNQYRSTGSFLGLGRQVGENTLVTMNYYNSYAGVPLPVSGVTPPYYTPAVQDFNRTQILSGTVRSQFSQVLSGSLTIGQVLQHRIEPNWYTNLPTDIYSSQRNQIVGHLTWEPSATASLTVGLDGSEETARSPNQVSETPQVMGKTKRLAILAEGQEELVPGLRAVASLRTESDGQDIPGAADTRITETTGKLGLNWTLPAGFRAYANAGTGFSTPLLYSALYNQAYGTGVVLQNEKSRSAQAGLGYAAGPWQAGLVLSRTLFANLNYFDLASNAYDFQNGSQIRIQSVEFKAGYETGSWGAGGFIRNQEARDLLAPAGQELSSSAVLNRPFTTLGANAFRILGDFRLEGRWSWTGPRYVYGAEPGLPFNEHYNDLSLSAAWAARKDLSFTLRGDNLMQPKTSLAQWQAGTREFQNDASLSFGYPAQSATVTLEGRYRF